MFSSDLGGYTAPLPSAGDPPFNKVALLLHGDGTNGAQNNTFVDSSTNNFTITRTGNVAQGTFSPFSLAEGQWSNYFDGSGDYVSTTYSTTALDWWNSDYTLEAWVYPTSLTGWGYTVGSDIQSSFIGNANPTSTINYWSFGPYTDGTVKFKYYNGASVIVSSTETVKVGQWNHVAMTKTSSGIVIWVNGIGNTATAVSGTPQSASGTPLVIGQINNTCINGYASSVRIVKGTAVYTANFTPPTSALTAISGTSLLTCQSNRFKDNSSNNFTITPTGDAKVTALSPFEPGAPYIPSINGGSGYFYGNADYLSIANNSSFDFGTGDFTIEGWVNYSAAGVSGQGGVILARWSIGGGSGVGADFFLGILNPNTLFFSINNSAVNIVASTTLPYNTWNHVAVVRNGTTFTLYQNGILVGTATSSAAVQYTAEQVLRTCRWNNPTSYLTGYLSDLRIVKGTAVYTSNFTPPTAPLTSIANTSLLLNCTNAGIIDNAGKNDIETVGNAQISTSVKKYGTGSMYFDGSGDYLKCTNVKALDLGTGDFTFEFWVYRTGTAVNYIFDARPSGLNWACYLPNTFAWYNGGATYGPTDTIPTNTWVHLAYARSGTTYYMFINGVLKKTGTDTVNYSTGSLVYIGSNNGLSEQMTGYIDDLRITKGQALYTSNFTPPTQAFPNV